MNKKYITPKNKYMKPYYSSLEIPCRSVSLHKEYWLCCHQALKRCLLKLTALAVGLWRSRSNFWSKSLWGGLLCFINELLCHRCKMMKNVCFHNNFTWNKDLYYIALRSCFRVIHNLPHITRLCIKDKLKLSFAIWLLFPNTPCGQDFWLDILEPADSVLDNTHPVFA